MFTVVETWLFTGNGYLSMDKASAYASRISTSSSEVDTTRVAASPALLEEERKESPALLEEERKKAEHFLSLRLVIMVMGLFLEDCL